MLSLMQIPARYGPAFCRDSLRPAAYSRSKVSVLSLLGECECEYTVTSTLSNSNSLLWERGGVVKIFQILQLQKILNCRGIY